ncbi:MAG: hypothetical protein HYY24_03885 [Verrucomicrobia bacterium]|nr:hypothetical protein [Verrucomicrobiota bacterium]
MPPARSKPARGAILRQVQTPLSFYVLALLIIESALAFAITTLPTEDKRAGFYWMIAVFSAVVLIVTGLTIWKPTHLLYGKEEHFGPALEPSALRDQVEDAIAMNVRQECLKKPEAKSRINP